MFLFNISPIFCCTFKFVYVLQVIPDDSTGELDSIEGFVEDNLDILKWSALAVVILQVNSLSFYSFVLCSQVLWNKCYAPCSIESKRFLRPRYLAK